MARLTGKPLQDGCESGARSIRDVDTRLLCDERLRVQRQFDARRTSDLGDDGEQLSGREVVFLEAALPQLHVLFDDHPEARERLRYAAHVVLVVEQ
jgi:hypothetical protein